MALTQVQGGMLAGSTNTTTTIQSNGTTAITIDSSQNVGIGVTSPTGKLAIDATNSNTPRIVFKNPSANGDAAISTFGSSTGTDVILGSNAYINSSGNFARFDAAQAGSYVYANRTGLLLFGTNTSSGVATERMRIDSDGNLIMASNAGYLGLPTNQTMRVPSTGGIGYVGNINSATVFQIAYNSTSAGVQLSSGATSWGTFSDSRLKNITGTYTNALNDIAQIEPVKFTWKSDENNKPQVGVVAQSVQNVVPEAVDSTTIEMDGTEEYLTVRYTELIPLMIASIQELKAELDATKAEVAALKGVN